MRCSILKGGASLQDSQWSGKQRKKEATTLKGKRTENRRSDFRRTDVWIYHGALQIISL